jgi:hypothetical protein
MARRPPLLSASTRKPPEEAQGPGGCKAFALATHGPRAGPQGDVGRASLAS